MFSKTCEYGLRAVIFIAQQSQLKNRVGVNSIAKEIGSPQAFTGKILQQLSRNKIIQSVKGPNGGFEIESLRLKNIYLSDIVQILDGDDLFTGCALGLNKCNADKPCPLHFKFVEIRNRLKDMLDNTSLEKLLVDMNTDLTWLKG